MLNATSKDMVASLRNLAYLLFPIITAVLLDASTIVIANKIEHLSSALWVLGQVILVSLPYFFAHYCSLTFNKITATIVWILGFVIYPGVMFYLQGSTEPDSGFIFTSNSAGFAIIVSLCHLVSLSLHQRKPNTVAAFMSRMLSLNSVVVFLLTLWVLFFSGIFVSTEDPMNNQPIMPVVNSKRLIENFGLFVSYLFQFGFLASLMGFIYWLNRYVLIRKVLAKQGLFNFAVASLFCILVLSPMLCSIALLIPLNQGAFTLIPSGNQNPLDPLNFRIFFVFLAVSTPVILAFERQQQSAEMEAAARRQVMTELKLLQQQINPHFLFNTLNNLYALTLKKSDDAPELLMQLSSLLRYSVYEGQRPLVKLEKEIAYLRDYIALQEIRLGDKAQLDIQWPEHLGDLKIPPLLLIVLLENAFKHGLEKSHQKCWLKMTIQVNGNQLEMICENHVTAEEESTVGGVGLENLRRRLELLFPEKFQLNSQRQGDKWHASLRLELEPC